jgi:GTP-binding protein EngB required for normal cell division
MGCIRSHVQIVECTQFSVRRNFGKCTYTNVICKFDNIMRKTAPGVETKSVVLLQMRQTGVTAACDGYGFKVIYGLRTAKTWCYRTQYSVLTQSCTVDSTNTGHMC